MNFVPKCSILQRKPQFVIPQTKLMTFMTQNIIIQKRMNNNVPELKVKKAPQKIIFPRKPGIPVAKLHKLEELCFAVVHVGGVQFKLIKGDVIMAQKLIGAPVGKEILLQKVLMIGAKTWTAIGTPLLEQARVLAIVEEQTETKKTIIFKKKRRKHYVRHNTHRQPFTTLRILDIFFDSKKHIDTSKGQETVAVSGLIKDL